MSDVIPNSKEKLPSLLGEFEGTEYYTSSDGYILIMVNRGNGFDRPECGVSNKLMDWAQEREAELKLPTYPKISF
jgi:hypothetical protein